MFHPNTPVPGPEIHIATAIREARQSWRVFDDLLDLLPRHRHRMVHDCRAAFLEGDVFTKRLRQDLESLLDDLASNLERETEWRIATVEVGAIGDEPLFDDRLVRSRTDRGLALAKVLDRLSGPAEKILHAHALIDAQQVFDRLQST
ncbi:hypothetical protein [Rhodovulum steppense]|uniref:Uncharacterized protein n=1 Tax=Rhodovulum steppense TaxID=540251 RepID=A0A4R1YIX5_9RHOB|nr:hypothetical protein [Rhodovulum steppense]TCM76381.1 hypothetical protein EV216_1349 [Rhodovulum steppense]